MNKLSKVVKNRKDMNKREKTGGRSKGTPNKTTAELRKLLTDFVSVNITTLQTEFDKLEPKEKLSIIEKMMRLILPPVKNEDNNEQLHPPVIIHLTPPTGYPQ